jgi:hypothetical protein
MKLLCGRKLPLSKLPLLIGNMGGLLSVQPHALKGSGSLLSFLL